MKSIDVKICTDVKNYEDWAPFRAHDYDAGADLYAADNYTIYPQNYAVVRTGVAVDIPEDYVGLLFSRSGMIKHKLRLSNCVGVIDSGYQGEILACIYNDDLVVPANIVIGDRVAQLVIVPIVTPKFRIVTQFDNESNRGAKGFGSTGK